MTTTVEGAIDSTDRVARGVTTLVFTSVNSTLEGAVWEEGTTRSEDGGGGADDGDMFRRSNTIV